ncbi:hypothetical protein EUX98_g9207 [Antrodiella citrinella]|uniref:Uncharacterized protein n=1 Tax=Antrodiella citrinella TaxID=2447956 RepID=A0A4S4LWW8_9APHY|nr:hypothetical protein EUX98_g9207 [Antrodiella citrinella]
MTSIPPGGSQPALSFNDIGQMTTCAAGTISWTTAGDPTALTLYVTNANNFDGGPEPQRVFTFLIAANINPSLEVYTWSPVNVTAGQYHLLGIFDGSLGTSATFLVVDGGDDSCLSAASNSTVGPSSTSSPSPTGVPVVSGALSSGSSSHAGAIAGGVIGGVVLILLILFGLFAFLRLRRRSKHVRTPSGAVGGAGKWNGLASRDSNLHSVLPTYASGDRKVPGGIRRQSAGLSSDEHGMRMELPSPVASDEDVSTLAEEEKIAHAHALGNAYFNTVTPLPYTGQPHHRHSSSGSRLDSPIAQVSPAASTRSTNRAATLAKLDPSLSPKTRRPSLDGRVLSSAPASAVQTPVSAASQAEMIPMNVNRASTGPRKATRKPVPTYGSTPSVAAMERERSASSGGHPRDAHGDSATTLNAQDAWKSSASSREDVRSIALSHKSSFGDGRPVHYLIPDMPPPQRE